MTTNPTDPEEIKLRSKVADLQIHISDCLIVGDLTGKEAAEAECRDIVGRIQDMRTKASAPEPVLRCEPPDPSAEGWYFLQYRDTDRFMPWHWVVSPNREWSASGGTISPQGIYEIGWRYHSPALPNTPQIPTHESIIQWAKEKDKESIRTGEALKWTELIPDFARVFGLLDAAKCYSPTTRLSNETLRDLWRLAHQEALDQFVTDAKGIIGR